MRTKVNASADLGYTVHQQVILIVISIVSGRGMAEPSVTQVVSAGQVAAKSHKA